MVWSSREGVSEIKKDYESDFCSEHWTGGGHLLRHLKKKPLFQIKKFPYNNIEVELKKKKFSCRQDVTSIFTFSPLQQIALP